MEDQVNGLVEKTWGKYSAIAFAQFQYIPGVIYVCPETALVDSLTASEIPLHSAACSIDDCY
jgi:hypothetical protein